MIYFTDKFNHQIQKKKINSSQKVEIKNISKLSNDEIDDLFPYTNTTNQDYKIMLVLWNEIPNPEISVIVDEKKMSQSELNSNLKLAELLLKLIDDKYEVEQGIDSLLKLGAAYGYNLGVLEALLKSVLKLSDNHEDLRHFLTMHAQYLLDEKLQNQSEYYLDNGVAFLSFSSAINQNQVATQGYYTDENLDTFTQLPDETPLSCDKVHFLGWGSFEN